MADQNPSDQAGSAANRRRSSFAGMLDLFGRSPSGSGSPPSGGSSFPGPITQAAAQAQQRRLSIATTGIGASPTSSSPLDNMRSRGQSISSGSSGSVDESPFEDGDGPPVSSQPTTPFARRVSFGARAMRDYKSPTSGSGGGGNANEGYNFAENMRARAERGSVSAGMSGSPPSAGPHSRAKSVAVMEPPAREIPAHPRKPDHFQERILKGDFYMD